jgi:hypothetical protein
MTNSFERTAAAVTAIQNLETVEEIRAVCDAIKQQQTYLSTRNIRKIVKGAVVSFTDSRGVKVVGTVTKVNRKTVEVLGGMSNGLFRTTYKVPGSLLTVEEYAPSAEAVAV